MTATTNDLRALGFFADWYELRLDPLEIPRWLIERRTRLAACAIARAFVGLGPSAIARYREAILPFDRPVWGERYLGDGVSTCGLICMAVARCLGADTPELWGPYEKLVGRAMGIVRKVGANSTALIDPLAPEAFLAGNFVLVGRNKDRAWARGKSPALEHVFTVTGADDDLLWSVDGGQGAPVGVKERKRLIVHAPKNELWLADPATGVARDGLPVDGRRADWVVDLGNVRLPYPALVPPSFDVRAADVG